MDDAYDFYRILSDAIESEILAGHKVPYAGGDIIPGDAGIREMGKLPPAAFDRVEHAVGGCRVLFRYFQPDRDKIFVCSTGAADRQGQGQSLSWRRASALISDIDRELKPLSNPSCTSVLSSSTV